MADFKDSGQQSDLIIKKAAVNVQDRISGQVGAATASLKEGITTAQDKAKSLADGTTTSLPSLGGNNPDTPFEALHSNVGWLENPLNDVQQATYHVRLFMTDDTPFSYNKFGSYDALYEYLTKSKKTTTVAESGVTGINIQSVIIETVPGPNAASRSMSANRITMSISEPGGVSFMDILSEAAMELRVKNYAKTQFFMEVTFMGYSDDGRQAGSFMWDKLNPCSKFPNKGKWLYQLFLLDIDSQLNESGGQYTLNFKPFEELFAEDDSLALPGHIAPQGATVADMCKDLMKKLNDHYEYMYGYVIKEYDIQFFPFSYRGTTYDPNDGSKFKLIPQDEHFKDKRAVTMTSTGDKFKASFAHGTALNDAIELIFANCEIVQQLAKNVMKIGDLDLTINKIRDAIVFRVYPVADVTGYDPITEQYTVKFTIAVHPYLSQRPILTADEVIQSQTPAAQAENGIKLRKNGYLAKRYDYLYTGQNTEVISFDIKHNAKWSAILPRAYGTTNSVESQTVQDLKNKSQEKLNTPEKIKLIRDAQDTMQAAKRELDAATEASTKIDAANAVKNSVTSSDEEKKTAEATIDQYKSKLFTDPKRFERLSSTISDTQAYIDKLRPQVQNDAKSRLPSIDPRRGQNRFAEEVQTDNLDEIRRRYEPMPISIQQSTADTRFYANGAFPDYYHRDRAIFGAIMDQLYETTGSAMQNAMVEVRGDPYWLGTGNVERCWAMANLATKYTLMEDSNVDPWRADYTKGDVLFMITYRYPRGITEGGAPEIRFNDFFTGVYYVVSVTHKFEGGKFIQTLNAKRMPIIEVFRAFGLRSETEIKQIQQNLENQRNDNRPNRGGQ